MSERFFRSNRPGYPHPVSSELENSGIRVAVGDCSVTERRRWRLPYQTGKTVHVHAKHYNTTRTDARRRVCAEMVPYRWATWGTSLRELEYTHKKSLGVATMCLGCLVTLKIGNWNWRNPSETDSIKFQISSKTSSGKKDSTKRRHQRHHQRQPGEQLFPIQVATD